MGFAITEDMIKNPDTYIDGGLDEAEEQYPGILMEWADRLRPLTVISERHQVAYEAIIAAHERYYNELAEAKQN